MMLERIRKISIQKKIIYLLLITILFLLIALLIKIYQTQNSYDKDKYAQVYSEYNEILGIEIVSNEFDASNIASKRKALIEKPTENVSAILDISKIGVFYPIISETTYDNLKISPTKFYGCDANEVGNFCIVGHNNRNAEQFSHLDELEEGDNVKLTSNRGDTLSYSVFKKYVVNATDLSCTSQLTDGQKILTLITCTDNGKRRLVVQCKA